MKKPSGSTAAKQASSARPGFQPSAAAHFTAIEISSGRIVRMLRSFMAGDPTKGLMKTKLPPVSRCRQTIERSGAALSFRIFSSIQETLEAKHEGTLMTGARLKHYGWGREGEGMSAEERKFSRATSGRCLAITIVHPTLWL